MRLGGGLLLHGIENALLDFITGTYNAIGWPGVIVMMAIESAAIPLPSELIMPLAGWKLIEAKESRHWSGCCSPASSAPSATP